MLFYQISSNFGLKKWCIIYTENKTTCLGTLFLITSLLFFHVTNSKFKRNVISLKFYFEEFQTTW